MSRWAVVAAAVGAVLVAVVALVLLRPEPKPDAAPTAAVEEALPTVDPEAPLRLYFPGGGGRLHPEERALEEPADGEERLRRVVEALLAGPASEGGLRAPFPEEVELASALLSHDGVAFVDLASPEPAPPSSGSREEMLAIYSVVNSVLLNVPQARRVAVLWNGVQRPSFAGHLDTSRPLAAKRDLMAAAER